MKLARIWDDAAGTSVVEFAVTAPAFLLLLLGIIEGGLMMWTQAGLQHGATMAARCASVNPSICGSASAIQNYAAQQAYGLKPPASAFSYSPAACGKQVSASYAYSYATSIFGMSAITLTAQSCYPT